MKIDPAAAILDLNDEPVISEGKPLTLRVVMQTALISPLRGDEDMKADDKVRAFNLAVDAKAPEMEITAENMTFLKARIGRAYAPVVVGRAFALLDPK